MKKLVLTAIAALCASGLWAAPVNVERAKTTATSFMKAQLGANMTVKEVVASTDTYYIMNLNPTGWVVVSADDTTEPVLGYSPKGRLNWSMVPSNMRGMLNVYSSEIKTIRTARKAQHPEWRALSRPTRAVSRAAVDEVQPMIPINMNQDSPWNKYCPGDGKTKSYVGCVAVAMSQAMSVQRFPGQPRGRKSYVASNYGTLSVNFDTEKPYDWDALIAGTNSCDEAARLLYHAGVSVEMNYGTEGSGIPSNQADRISTALGEYFGYNKGELRCIWRDSYQQDWDDLIYNEIQAGRAVVYNAIDDVTPGMHSGHSFNIDGYQGNGFFHVNWGWGGSGNAYFKLNSLANGQFNYNSYHVAIVGIGSPDRVLRSIQLSDQVIDEGLPVGTVVAQITVNGEAPKSTFDVQIFGEYDPQRNEYKAVPFKLQGDLIVTTEVLRQQAQPIIVNVRVDDTQSTDRLVSAFNITVCKMRSIGEATSLSFDRTTRRLLIKTRNGLNYTLRGADGSAIGSGALAPVPHMTLDLNTLPAGENTLTLTDGTATKTIKIKK